MIAFIRQVLSTVVGMLIAFSILAVVIPLSLALLVRGMQAGGGESVQDKSILQLRLKGRLVEHHRPLDLDLSGRLFFSEDNTIGLYETLSALRSASEDKRIQGVFMDMRDLQAGWAGVTALQRGIKEFAKTGKFVYAYADALSEKTVYLSSAADRVFLEPSGEVEWNGLAVTEAFLRGFLDKWNVEPRVFKAGKFKSAVEPFILEKMSAENRQQNQTLVDDIWGVVRAEVAAARGKTDAELDRWASQLELSGAASAEKLGVVHELAFYDHVEDAMRLKTVGEDEELNMVTPGRYLRDLRFRHLVPKSNQIAILFAEGEIVSGNGGRDHIGSDSFVDDIREARDDDDIKAIVIRVDSPGGDALASDVIWREIALADEEKPVVISMGDVAASGGYYISAGGRYIFAEPTTITGSIGVFGLMFGVDKFLKKNLSVNMDRVATHPFADIGSAVRPIAPQEAKFIQNSVERVYNRFLEVVKEGRGYEDIEDVKKLAEGRVWSGTRALELELVDELGGLSQAVKKAAEFAEIGDDYSVQILPHEREAFSELLGRLFDEEVQEKILARVGQSLGLSEAWLKQVLSSRSWRPPKVLAQMLLWPEIK